MEIKHLIFPLMLILISCKQETHPGNTTEEIDIISVSDSLTLFGEGEISTPLYERDFAINPDGDEIIYSLGDYKQSIRCLVILRNEKGKWTKPEIMSISGKYHDIEPFYANDGNRLYFASKRPVFNDSTRSDYNIWYSDKLDGNWTEPVALDSVINSTGDEYYPSLGRSGNLYFTASRENGPGREDIYVSVFSGGEFKSPEALPAEINTSFYEFNAYISPDEDLIIFSSYGREDDLGGGDLYMSRKDENGIWTPAKNMGKMINSDKLDYCPFIDWKYRNFYFTSERAEKTKDQLTSVESLVKKSNSVLNGFGNIYKIGFDKILLPDKNIY